MLRAFAVLLCCAAATGLASLPAIRGTALTSTRQYSSATRRRVVLLRGGDKDKDADSTDSPAPAVIPPSKGPTAKAFIGVTMLASFCIGLIFGWGPFAKILEEEGVAAAACGADAARPCGAQTVFYSLVYTLASCSLAFGGLPAGLLLDTAGPVTAALVAGSLISAGNALLAWLPAGGAPLAFVAPFMLMGSGGILTALTAFKVAAVFPAAASTLITAVNAIFDVSAVIPLGAYRLYHKAGLSRARIFGPFALYVALLYVCWAALWRRFEPALRAPPPPQTAAAAEAATAVGNAETKKEPFTPLDDPKLSLRQVLRSKQFLVGVGWFAVHQLRANLYLGSAADMLRAYGDTNGVYMQYLTGMLVLALPAIPLISASTDRLGVAGSMQAVTLLAAVHAACCLVPSLPFQLVTFLVFTLLRAATFSVASLLAARTFGFAKLGTTYGLMQCAGALLNLAMPLITRAVLAAGGAWAPVFWSLLAVCVPQLLLVTWAVRTL